MAAANPTLAALSNLKKTAKAVCEGKKTKADLKKAKSKYVETATKRAKATAEKAGKLTCKTKTKAKEKATTKKRKTTKTATRAKK